MLLRRNSPVGPRRRQLLKATGVGIATVAAGCTGLTGRASKYNKSQAEFDPALLPYDETYPDDEGITMFRHGLRRLGYYPDVTVPDSVTVNWQRPMNYVGHTAAKSSPLPVPGRDLVVIPADTGRIHGVTRDGRHRWTRQTGATNQGFHGTPAIVDDTAYIGGYDGTLHALDVETGDTVWRTPGSKLDGTIAIGSSPAYWDGVIYVVAEYRNPKAGTMWAIDAADGEPLWSDDRVWGMPHPSTAIDPETERMVIGSNDGVCYCWEFPSLEFEWEFETGAEIKGTTPLYDGAVFVGSWDGHVYRLDLEDGTEDWSFETGAVTMSNPGIDPDAGVVYVGSDNNHVQALDTDSGEELWSRHVGGSVIGSVTVTADCVLVGSYDTHLYALEKETGEVRWRVENNGHVTSEPVPSDGRIFYAERGDISGYYSDDEEEVVETPGHAYCLVPDE